MNNLTCWLVTCRPGTSVLVLVLEEPILPAHAAASRRGQMPASPVGLAYGRITPPSGQSDRPSVRVAHRPSQLSRHSLPPCMLGNSAFAPRRFGSLSHVWRATRAWVVSGVHRSFRPLPTH